MLDINLPALHVALPIMIKNLSQHLASNTNIFFMDLEITNLESTLAHIWEVAREIWAEPVPDAIRDCARNRDVTKSARYALLDGILTGRLVRPTIAEDDVRFRLIQNSTKLL